MKQSPNAILIYQKGHEGRGIGLYHKIQAYKLQRDPVLCLDTVQANQKLGFPSELRSFDKAVEMLQSLRPLSIVLYSNNPEKKVGCALLQ